MRFALNLKKKKNIMRCDKYTTAHLTLHLSENQTRGHISTMSVAYRLSLRYKHYVVYYWLWSVEVKRVTWE